MTNLIACYQFTQSVLKIGSALAERVEQRGRWVGVTQRVTVHAWWLLRLAVEKPWSMPGGPLFCFLAQMGVENASFTSISGILGSF